MIKNQNKLKCNRGQNSKSSPHSNEELELSLEVEIDDEVREIIRSPRRCASALLDVTIIRPEDVEKLYSIHKKTLKGTEVKKFINAMNFSKNDVKRIVENMIEANKGKSAGDYRRESDNTRELHTQKNELNGRIRNLLLEDDIFSDDISLTKNSVKVNQIYTTPKTFHELGSMFQCKNKSRKESNGKTEMPCTCENCAIVSVVTDSQKRPFATEATYDPRDSTAKRDSTKKRKVSYYSDEHTECQHYFRYLSAKIKTLEARIHAQEDRAVPKEYFKKIIAKLISNTSKTATPSQVNLTSSLKRTKDPQYKGYSTDDHSYENFKNKHHARAFVIQPNDTKTFTRPSSKKTSSSVNDTPLWKWGEEVLRPGIDIKNKIVQLLEETMKNLRWSKPSSAKSDMKDVVDEMSQNLYKTVHDIPEREEAAYRRKDSHRRRSSKGGSSVNVSYINPTQWDESQMSLILESEDENGGNLTRAKPVEYCEYWVI